MPKVRAHVFVEGRVQGVFFRSETQKTARQHNVQGWVRNLPDNRVEAVFEGEEAAVEEMIAWCYKGPPHALVSHAEIIHEDFTGEFDGFSILF